MENLKSCAIVVCVAATVIALIKNFIPSEKFEQPMKLLLSAFAVLAVMTPLKNVVGELPELAKQSVEYRGDYSDKAADILSEQLSIQLNNKLHMLGIETESITAVIKIDDENGIYIQSVGIDISKEFKDREGEIKELILKETGIGPQIEFKSEEG